MMTERVVAVIDGAVKVTANGVLFDETCRNFRRVRFRIVAQPGLVRFDRPGDSRCRRIIAHGSHEIQRGRRSRWSRRVSSIVSKPFAVTITIEIVELEPPPQPLDNIKARHARQNTAANRILLMQPPEFP